MIGIVGEISVLVAFVATLVALGAFVRATLVPPATDTTDWGRIGRWAWGIMLAGCAVASAMLWTALFTRDFSYAYIYQQTSHAGPGRRWRGASVSGRMANVQRTAYPDRWGIRESA